MKYPDFLIGLAVGFSFSLLVLSLIVFRLEHHIEKSIKLAYGLLWTVPIDRTTHAGWTVSEARRSLYEVLTKRQQRDGIAAAMRHNEKHVTAPKDKFS